MGTSAGTEEKKAASKLIGKKKFKKALFQMFSAAAGDAHKTWTSRSLPGPELSTQHGTSSLAGSGIVKVSLALISAQLYLYSLHLDLPNSLCSK